MNATEALQCDDPTLYSDEPSCLVPDGEEYVPVLTCRPAGVDCCGDDNYASIMTDTGECSTSCPLYLYSKEKVRFLTNLSKLIAWPASALS